MELLGPERVGSLVAEWQRPRRSAIDLDQCAYSKLNNVPIVICPLGGADHGFMHAFPDRGGARRGHGDSPHPRMPSTGITIIMVAGITIIMVVVATPPARRS